jgi:GNAT superfamily N-acetyltransferase
MFQLQSDVMNLIPGNAPSEGDDRHVVVPDELLVPGPYPVELESELFNRSNNTLRLRPIRSDDADKLKVFHHHLSFDSIYRRYFSVHPELSDKEVLHLTQVDYIDRLAYVIEHDDELVAVGRYDRYPFTTRAEVAFVIRDDYQHQGLGHLLLDALADAAWRRGITDLLAETLFTNHDMMSVFRHSGFPMTSSIMGGEIAVRLSIEPTSESAARQFEHRSRTN